MSGDREGGVPTYSSFDAVVESGFARRSRTSSGTSAAPIGTLPIDSLEVLEVVCLLEEEMDVQFDVTWLTPEALDIISARELYHRLAALVD